VHDDRQRPHEESVFRTFTVVETSRSRSRLPAPRLDIFDQQQNARGIYHSTNGKMELNARQALPRLTLHSGPNLLLRNLTRFYRLHITNNGIALGLYSTAKPSRRPTEFGFRQIGTRKLSPVQTRRLASELIVLARLLCLHLRIWHCASHIGALDHCVFRHLSCSDQLLL